MSDVGDAPERPSPDNYLVNQQLPFWFSSGLAGSAPLGIQTEMSRISCPDPTAPAGSFRRGRAMSLRGCVQRLNVAIKP